MNVCSFSSNLSLIMDGREVIYDAQHVVSMSVLLYFTFFTRLTGYSTVYL